MCVCVYVCVWRVYIILSDVCVWRVDVYILYYQMCVCGVWMCEYVSVVHIYIYICIYEYIYKRERERERERDYWF